METTQELLRPDLEETRPKKWWHIFSCAEHCWHEGKLDKIEVGNTEARYCCNCGRSELARLEPVEHGTCLKQEDRENVTLIWTAWKKKPSEW